MLAAVLEVDARSDQQVLDRSRREDLVPVSHGRHPRRDVHSQTAHAVPPELHLAGVDPGPHPKVERRHGLADGAATTYSPPRPVEGGEEPVAGGIHLASAESVQLAADNDIVLVEHLAPAPVPELGGARRRPDDVGEEERGKDAVELAGAAGSSQELLDLVDDGVAVLEEDDVIGSRELAVDGAVDVLGQKSPDGRRRSRPG